MAVEYTDIPGGGGHVSLGFTWAESGDGYNVYVSPELWRMDSAADISNPAARAAIGIDGMGAWYGKSLDPGAGGRWTEILAPGSHAYARGHSDYTVTARIDYEGVITFYNGGYYPPDGYMTWTLTISAKASHAVTFDANGGTGAPAGVTKWYGEQVAIPSTAPTRANYEFLGWSASKTAASASYSAGCSYWTDDADMTLYAVWKLVSNPPTVALEVTRCTSAYAADAEGTYAMAVVTWSVDAETVSSNVGKTVAVSWSPSTGASSKSASVSAKSGTTTLKLGSGFDGSSAYSLTATVTDSLGLSSTTVARRIGPVFHTLDIGNKGNSMGLGAVASDDANQLAVGFDEWMVDSATIPAATVAARLQPLVWRWAERPVGDASSYTADISEWVEASVMFANKLSGPPDHTRYYTVSGGTMTAVAAGYYRISFAETIGTSSRALVAIYKDSKNQAEGSAMAGSCALASVSCVLHFEAGECMQLKENFEGSGTKILGGHCTWVEIEYLGET